MKKYLFISFFLIATSFLFAGPFGLEMGMTLEQITEVCDGIEPYHLEEDIYLIEPLKRHPLFPSYAVYVDEKLGLYSIRAISDEITSNKYGRELKNAFDDITERVAKTYGQPRIIENKDPNDYYINRDDYWFYTIKEGSREYYALWTDDLKDNLIDIVVDIRIISGVHSGEGILRLTYWFKNETQIHNEEDSVF